MIQLLKNHFYVLCFIFIAACSSNTNVGQDDLSISEIEDIEKTGEFSQEDFFKDEEILKENDVKVDIEGLDDKNIKSKNNSLVSDIEVEDFEGEGFDKQDDFETDLETNSKASEFDEFDEFVTTDKVAKNEEIVKQEPTSIGDIAEEPTQTEEDIFSEFEESTDVAAKKDMDPSVKSALESSSDFNIEEVPVENAKEPDLDFENAFKESETAVENEVTSNDVDVDTTLDTDVDVGSVENAAKNQFEDVFSEEQTKNEEESQTNVFDSDFGPGKAPEIAEKKTDEVLNISDAQETRTSKQILENQYYEKPQQIVTAIKQQVQSWIPVKKMRDEPYDQDGILLNALYIVREGDNFKSIGEKIYGKGSINNLSRVNPFLNPKRLKVGEKVYYNSPNRPTDQSKMLFYYDDIGRSAQFRQVETGENIRTVAQELLGHPRSWMEIWATNPEIVSKAEVDRPYRVRYFSNNNEQSMVQDGQDSEMTGSLNQPQSNPQENLPEFSNNETQISANTDQDSKFNEPSFEEPDPNAAATTEENGFDEPAPTETAQNNPVDPATNNNPEENFDQGFDEAPAQGQEVASMPENLNRPIQEAGGMKSLFMGLDQKTIEMVGMAGGGLVLMILLLMYARKRRMMAQATQVQDFDFTGSTKIDEQTKTHIEI